LPSTGGVAVEHDFGREGFEIAPAFLSAGESSSLAAELTALLEQQQGSVRNKIGGIRNLLRLCPLVAEIAVATRIASWLGTLAGRPVFPVRALFFDKTPEANWRVPWHQDLTIAVVRRIETPGFETWSLKDEINHVQPPTGILEGMVALRLHLDDCHSANGALKVIPGSHLHGKLKSADISEWVEANPEVVCEVPRGGALVIRPLLLHASAPAASPAHRRVLHIEYATDQLPNGLKWFDA